MATQNKILNTLFLVIAALGCIMVVIQASPVPSPEEVVAVASADTAERDGRFYGLEQSQATAFAAANAGSSGLGYGYPYGGGDSSFASATATAQAGSIGYPYGK